MASIPNITAKITAYSTNSTRNYGTDLPSPTDGSTSTYFGTTTSSPNTFQIEKFSEDIKPTKIRIYSGSSYRPREFRLQGSNDETSWTDIVIGELANTTGWKEFEFEESDYRYYNLIIESRHTAARLYLHEVQLVGNEHYSKKDGGRIFIRFTESLIGDVTNNENYFTIKGKEYDFVPGGTLIDKIYTVSSVSRVDSRTIVLDIDLYGRFESVVGPLTVIYSGRTLIGDGGPVSPFEESFTPEGLVAKPNQNPSEHIDLKDIRLSATLTKIDFPVIGDSNTEHIDLADIKITANLIHIDDI